MRPDYHQLLLIFVDGLGLAPAGRSNPLSGAGAPALTRLLGGPPTLERLQQRDGLMLSALDAGLDTDGLPQSATGQTALFTGINGARLVGHHVVALPGPRLRAVIREHSIFRRLVDRGLTATFANAYSQQYLDDVARGDRRPSVTTCAVGAAGLGFRRVPDLLRGEAVSWDIERDHFAARAGIEADAIPPVSGRDAGGHLGTLARGYHLTVFETFLTDLAGHARYGISPDEAIGRVDALVGGALEAMEENTTLILTSDHGNVEDTTRRSHTRNPVPLLCVGPLAGAFAGLSSILEVSATIEQILAESPSS